MDVRQVVADIDEGFRKTGTPERSEYMKKYLKSALVFRGVDTPGIRKRTRAFTKSCPDLRREDLVALARACWDEPVYEVRSFAVGVLKQLAAALTAGDLELVEDLVRRSATWAHVDGLALGVGATLVERYPETGQVLDRWARDGCFWVRRAAMLVLLPPLEHGSGDLTRFLRYADDMLDEKEFFIRKAIGWVLRAVSKSDPDAVDAFVSARTARISGVTIREAVKYLPQERRAVLMSAYKARR